MKRGEIKCSYQGHTIEMLRYGVRWSFLIDDSFIFTAGVRYFDTKRAAVVAAMAYVRKLAAE